MGKCRFKAFRNVNLSFCLLLGKHSTKQPIIAGKGMFLDVMLCSRRFDGSVVAVVSFRVSPWLVFFFSWTEMILSRFKMCTFRISVLLLLSAGYLSAQIAPPMVLSTWEAGSSLCGGSPTFGTLGVAVRICFD